LITWINGKPPPPPPVGEKPKTPEKKSGFFHIPHVEIPGMKTLQKATHIGHTDKESDDEH
jgi:hypothetical protein